MAPVPVRRLLILALLLVAGACSPPPASGPVPARRQANLLTADEIQSTHLPNALEVVRSLRPQWLRTRGRTSIRSASEIWVYVDGIRLGGSRTLETIPSGSVETMRFHDASSATQRWGTDHVDGAIEVRTR